MHKKICIIIEKQNKESTTVKALIALFFSLPSVGAFLSRQKSSAESFLPFLRCWVFSWVLYLSFLPYNWYGSLSS